MSTILLMHIIPSDKWMTGEYVRTNSVAVLFCSDWHTHVEGLCVNLRLCGDIYVG